MSEKIISNGSRFNRLGGRIVLIVVACALLTTAVVLFRDLGHDRTWCLKKEQRIAASQASLLVTYLEHLMLEGDHKNIRPAVEAMRGHVNIEDVRVLNSDRKVIISLDRKLEGTTAGTPVSGEEDYDLLTFDFPIKSKPECVRCHGKGDKLLGYFEFAASPKQVYADIKSWKDWHLTAAGISLAVICVIIVFTVMRMVNRPLHVLLNAMGKAGAGDYSVRVPENIPGEMGIVSKGFNLMVDRLAENRAELEKLNRESISHVDRLVSLGELAASLAHEIRNPLTGIAAAIQVLQRDLPSGDRRAIVLGEVLRQVSRLNKTVDNLLSYARPSAPVMARVAMPDVINRVLSILGQQLKNQNITVTADSDGGLPPVTADSSQLEQVVMNLCINSIQAMPGGGKLGVRLRLSENGKSVVTEISDTGTGIDPENISSVFKPFFTTRAKGTGLGLAIVKRIIDSHNGKIEVRSEAGKGTTFTVNLPAGDTEA